MTNPTQNIDIICSFFFGDILSLASIGNGSVRMARSRKISTPPLANPNLNTSFSRLSK
jgi:isocitrate/isopropylmalate dehydrogenase